MSHPAWRVAPGAAVAILLSAGAATAAERRWAPEPCRIQGLDEEVRCGVFEVFENRATRKGPRIPLKVLVLPATGKVRRADPVVFFAGGPGDSATRGAAFIAGTYRTLRDQRDIVLVDVRGTGGSAPLECEELTGQRGVQAFLSEFLPVEGVKACYGRLSARDLGQYVTDSAVDDVADVVRALGYDRANLVGASYGTRAVLVYLRRHPRGVRTAVLQGTIPPDGRSPLTFARDAQAALDGLLAECSQDAACAAAFPKLGADLQGVLGRLASGPVTVEVKNPRTGEAVPLTLTAMGLAQTIRYMLYIPGTASHLPLYLHEAAHGNFAPMAETAYFFSSTLGAGGLSDGMFLSVTCSEDVPWIEEGEVAKAVQGTFLGDFRIRQQQAACAAWPVKRVSADYLKPVVSGAPTLLLSGERDPVTPARFGEQVARHLSRSRHLVVEDAAHGLEGMKGSECIDRLITEFIAAGTVEGLDTSCLKGVERPPFLLALPKEKLVEVAPERLKSYGGTYLLAEAKLTISVAFAEGQLRATVPGQPPFLLEPVSETRFRIAGLPQGFYVEFLVEGGSVTGLRLEQGPGTVSELVRRP